MYQKYDYGGRVIMRAWPERDEIQIDDMAWVSPEYGRDEVNRAARVLISPAEFSDEEAERAFSIISNWRSSHSFPLNTFQTTLRSKTKQVSHYGLVAQRLKRLSSIAQKLRRFPKMKMSQMQDIAGCRAIMESIPAVNQLVRMYKRGGLKHGLVHEDDYIQRPKPSGYRGVHLIYRYYSDKKSTYNDHKVEVQIRSALQHSWATAVETVGTFVQQALKASQGEEGWLRFFALMGTAIAIKEHAPPVPNTPTTLPELTGQLRHFAKILDVENHLTVYAAALQAPELAGAKDAHYFLLELDPPARRVKITGYKPNELDRASNDYLAVERDAIASPGERDAVLVSVESVEALKRAYPNYFLDAHRFIETVKEATEGSLIHTRKKGLTRAEQPE